MDINYSNRKGSKRNKSSGEPAEYKERRPEESLNRWIKRR